MGGNTSCVEVTSKGQRLILDAGTGIRGLGEQLIKSGGAQAPILFSHLHWDHVQGFPFFAPAWHPASRFELYGPGPGGDHQLKDVLARQMQAPNFPVPLQAMKSNLSFESAISGKKLEFGPFTVLPFEVPHPQGCLGYRIEADGRAFVYMTDVELNLAQLPKLGRFIEGADALVLDAQYTPDEYATKKGWGHSSVIEAALVAKATHVGRLFLFHHDPAHNDDFVDNMAKDARDIFEKSEPAREGLLLEVA
jgi:phosphoribosyl 1,2-cyclic phosphodiesterase